MNTKFELANDSRKPERETRGEKWAAVDIGGWNELPHYIMENRELGLKCPSKLFLKDFLNLTGAEISFNTLPKGTDYLGKHKHLENEEIIIVISGSGKVLVGENEISISAGSIVKIGTGLVRAVKSSGTEDLIYICIQTKENSLVHYTLTDAQML